MFRRIRQHRKPRIIPEIHRVTISNDPLGMFLYVIKREFETWPNLKETLEMKWLMLNLVFKNELH